MTTAALAGQPRHTVRGHSRAPHPSLAAVLTYLACLPLAFGAVAMLGRIGPWLASARLGH